jgi:hypothetical protein
MSISSTMTRSRFRIPLCHSSHSVTTKPRTQKISWKDIKYNSTNNPHYLEKLHTYIKGVSPKRGHDNANRDQTIQLGAQRKKKKGGRQNERGKKRERDRHKQVKERGAHKTPKKLGRNIGQLELRKKERREGVVV